MQGRTGRIVVAYRLGTLGSANSLLCGVNRRKNAYQPFLLGFQIRTVAPKGANRFKSKARTAKRKNKGHHTGVLCYLVETREIEVGTRPKVDFSMI